MSAQTKNTPAEIAALPNFWEGCVSTWQETQKDNVIRSEMASGAVKIRQRFTSSKQEIETSFFLVTQYYTSFINWFKNDTANGIKAFYIKNPAGVQTLVRATAPPEINFLDAGVFSVSLSVERFNTWQ